ncbi:hypothetical protein QR64_09865 [Rhodococcus sp. Chr-9]|nr:hypothetical protein QR64_09865 [Rhodococcus sp. Chr-9]
MVVEVAERPLVRVVPHLLLRLLRAGRHPFAATGRDRAVDERVDTFATVGRHAHQHLTGLRGVADVVVGEHPEHLLLEQHHVGLIVDLQAGGVLVAERLVERESERVEECAGGGDVLDGEIDEQHARHGFSCGRPVLCGTRCGCHRYRPAAP